MLKLRFALFGIKIIDKIQLYKVFKKRKNKISLYNFKTSRCRAMSLSSDPEP